MLLSSTAALLEACALMYLELLLSSAAALLEACAPMSLELLLSSAVAPLEACAPMSLARLTKPADSATAWDKVLDNTPHLWLQMHHQDRFLDVLALSSGWSCWLTMSCARDKPDTHKSGHHSLRNE